MTFFQFKIKKKNDNEKADQVQEAVNVISYLTFFNIFIEKKVH